MIKETVSVGFLAPIESRQAIQGLTVSFIPPQEAGALDAISHRIKDRFGINWRNIEED